MLVLKKKMRQKQAYIAWKYLKIITRNFKYFVWSYYELNQGRTVLVSQGYHFNTSFLQQ